MTTKKVSVWYDEEGDMLEVLWAFREGYLTPTDDDRILKRLDDDGEVIGFLIHDMSTLTDPCPVEFELDSEAADVDLTFYSGRLTSTSNPEEHVESNGV
jgi:hypothetical protein